MYTHMYIYIYLFMSYVYRYIIHICTYIQLYMYDYESAPSYLDIVIVIMCHTLKRVFADVLVFFCVLECAPSSASSAHVF